MNLEAIANNLQANGFNIEAHQLKASGRWESCKLINSRAGAKPGGYIINVERNICSWKNFKENSQGCFPLDRSKVASRHDFEAIRKAQEKALYDKYFANAKLAYSKYNQISRNDLTTSPYLTNKHLEHLSGKIDEKGNLVIPFYNEKGYVRTLQTIQPNGFKLWESDCEKKSNYHIIGADVANKFNTGNEPKMLLIAEGYSTAASLYKATGIPTVVAADAGNVMPVLTKLQKLYPNTEMAICADNDHTNAKNVGLDVAKLCVAKFPNVKLVVPDFSQYPDNSKMSDFNDIHVVSGLDAVKSQINEQININSFTVIEEIKAEKTQKITIEFPDLINDVMKISRNDNFQTKTINQDLADHLVNPNTNFLDQTHNQPLNIKTKSQANHYEAYDGHGAIKYNDNTVTFGIAKQDVGVLFYKTAQFEVEGELIYKPNALKNVITELVDYHLANENEVPKGMVAIAMDTTAKNQMISNEEKMNKAMNYIKSINPEQHAELQKNGFVKFKEEGNPCNQIIRLSDPVEKLVNAAMSANKIDLPEFLKSATIPSSMQYTQQKQNNHTL